MAVIKFILIISALCFSTLASSQQIVSLKAAAATDLNNTQVQASTLPALHNQQRTPVAYSWSLLGQQQSLQSTESFIGSSKVYWQRVSGEQLSLGIELLTEAEQALIQIQPILEDFNTADVGEYKQQALALGLDPASLELINDRGSFQGMAAMQMIAGAQAVARADMGFPSGMTAFRLRKDFGAGVFQLKSNARLLAKQKYLISVLDQHSDIELNILSQQDIYLEGQALSAKSWFSGNIEKPELVNSEGYLLSPGGDRFELNHKMISNGNLVPAEMMHLIAKTGGLWEAHLDVRANIAGKPVRRHVKTAFAVSGRHARVLPEAQVQWLDDGDLMLTFDLEVATASRYNLSLVLATSHPAGVQDLMIASTANWLEPGTRSIQLLFEAEKHDIDLSGHLVLKNLELSDQGRLSVLQKQAEVLQLNNRI